MAAAIASAMAGVCGGVSGAESRVEVGTDRRVKLDILEKISAGSSFRRPEQGRQAVLEIRGYIAALQQEGVQADEAELSRATDLVISRLYYPQDKIQEMMQEGAGELPIAAIDLEVALIGYMRRLPPSAASGPNTPGGLIGRLKSDILWYNNYENTPAVWEHAALHYRTLFLPGDGPVSLRQFADFLKELPKLHAISSRAVRDSCPRLRLEPDKELLSAGSPPEKRMEYLEQWRALIMLFRDHLLLEAGNPRSLSEKEAEAFRRWHQERLVASFMPAIRRMLLRKTTVQERHLIGWSLADGVMAEKGLPAAMSQVRRWGLAPEAAITAPAFSRPPEGAQAPIGESSRLYLDVYRGAMGGEHWISGTLTERQQTYDPVAQRSLRRNSGPVFLAALQHLSGPVGGREETDPEVGMLMILAHEGMKGEASQLESLPDLAEWGERAALFLSVEGGGRQELSAEEYLRAKGRRMRSILVSGFPRRDTYGNDTGKHVPGIFTQYQERLADELCRRFGITDPGRRQNMSRSDELKDTKARDRLAFLTAFHEAAPKLQGADAILRDWGFTEEELAALRGPRDLVAAEEQCEP